MDEARDSVVAGLVASGLIDTLTGIVGAAHVLLGDDMAARWDGYPPTHPVTAKCIVRPASTAQVAEVVRACAEHDVSIIPHGGRTGLSGGTRATPEQVVISTERLRSIDPVDIAGGTIRVEAGVALQTIQQAAAKAGLFYPVDLGARGSATIGGTIATNAGGNSVFRYGMTREQVLGLEVVLADGTVLDMQNRLIKNNTGYDLKQLFIGSEGTLGVVTAAILRLLPSPGQRATVLAGLDDFDSVLTLLQFMGREAGGTLTSFEVMWPDFFELVLEEPRHARPMQGRHQFYVLADCTGEGSAELMERIVSQAWERGLLSDAVLAGSLAQADALWAIRDDIDAMASRMRPLFSYDISIRQSLMTDYVDTLRTRLHARWPGAALAVFGHIADGNLHVVICTGQAEDHADVDALVYELLRPHRGSVSAEHGIGQDKRSYLDVSRTPEEILLMRHLKGLFDPRNIMNPGVLL